MKPLLVTGLSVAEFQKIFPNEPSCAAYLFKCRWPDGFVCPVCKSGRYAALRSRAYSYECLDCGRQTSITAGTMMHRSKQPLTLWFLAAHLIATESSISVRQLEKQLGITYKTAWLLKQKFRRSMNCGPLDGLVEVGHTEVSPGTGDRSLRLSGSGKVVVAVAIDTRSYQIRLAAISDDTAESMQAFIRANVKPGAMLREKSPVKRSNYLCDVQQFEPLTPDTFELLHRYVRRRHQPINQLLSNFAIYHNEVQFETLLGIVALGEPMTYWDILGLKNPRKGTPTIRRAPRHRKTAMGMRQDGSSFSGP